MFLAGSMGEVEAGYVHARLDKPLDFGRRTTGWPDGADYLSSSAQVHSLLNYTLSVGGAGAIDNGVISSE